MGWWCWGGEVVFAVEVDVLVDGGRVGGRERRVEVQRLGDVHDPTQGAPVAETTPMAESMHRYAPKPLCFVHLLRSPLAGGTMKEAPISKGRNTLSSQTELHEIIQAKKDLDPAEQTRFELAYFRQRKDPTAALLLSIFLGVLGVDRFYVGDIGLGVAKLLTGGGFFIWVIIDWFLIRDATAAKNTAAIREVRASILAVRAS